VKYYEHVCKVCGSPFDSEGTRAHFCSTDCKNTSRRERYAKNDKMAEAQRARAREYQRSNRARVLRKIAINGRRNRGEMPWYDAPIGETPKGLRPLKRLYWEAIRRIYTGNVNQKTLAVYMRVVDKFKKYRGMRRFTRDDLAEIRAFVIRSRNSLDSRARRP
jgi:tRNA(Ile2) C34 agmatinyltransferase TiaS